MSNRPAGLRAMVCVQVTQVSKGPRHGASGEEPTPLSHQRSRQPLRGKTLAEKVILVLRPVIL